MTVRRISIAEAMRKEFERLHPRGKNTLLCVGLCRQRKDRTCFRETPSHGRAASCRSCEGSTWDLELRERTYWELEQEREKLRAYQRYARRLKLQQLVSSAPSSADAFSERMGPFEKAVSRRSAQWGAAWESVMRGVWDEQH